MSRFSFAICLIALASCSGESDPDSLHTIFLQLDHPPTVQDTAEVRTRGAVSIVAIPIARAIALRSSLAPGAYLDIPGVRHSVDMGLDADPLRSVFIEVLDEPTEADTAFVRAAGAEQVGIVPPTTVAAMMRLSALPGLGGYPRFLSVSVGLDDNVPQ